MDLRTELRQVSPPELSNLLAERDKLSRPGAQHCFVHSTMAKQLIALF